MSFSRTVLAELDDAVPDAVSPAVVDELLLEAPAGVLRLFVTGDCPEGDRLPRYLRTPPADDDESSAPLLEGPAAANTVVVAGTRCGSAV